MYRREASPSSMMNSPDSRACWDLPPLQQIRRSLQDNLHRALIGSQQAKQSRPLSSQTAPLASGRLAVNLDRGQTPQGVGYDRHRHILHQCLSVAG